MIDVQKEILRAMKKEIFNSSEGLNKASRTVLAELKTKQKDLLTPPDDKIQHQILKKMVSDREKSAEVYRQNGREDLAAVETYEVEVLTSLLAEVEKNLPAELSEAEIRGIIEAAKAELAAAGTAPNMGLIMKKFQNVNADKALVAKLVKSML